MQIFEKFPKRLADDIFRSVEEKKDNWKPQNQELKENLEVI